MSIFAETKDYKLIHDDMLNMLEYILPNSIDSIVCDPPYELGFMAKSWDKSGIAVNPEAWKKCFEVLKEGGYLLAFGGTRTYHRIACAIEDAGFEIRDCIMYLYGSGFPKSHNIGLAVDKKNGIESEVIGGGKSGISSRAYQSEETTTAGKYDLKQATNEWQGWGTALKPAYEPIIVARKPFKGSVAENILKNGVGGINIDECRIETDDFYSMPEKKTPCAVGYQRKNKSMFTDKNASEMNQLGRFPSNVIHDGSDEATKDMPSGGKNGSITKPYEINNQVYGDYGSCKPFEAFDDEGSASRYFYCAKASKKDRDDGLEAFEKLSHAEINNRIEGSKGTTREYGGGTNPYLSVSSPRKNIHPTVKPCELMQYLIRLVTPKGGTILDPFMGSGSTGKAAMFENREREANYHFIGIELTEEYLPICQARIEYAINKYEYDEKLEREKTGQLSLFEIED